MSRLICILVILLGTPHMILAEESATLNEERNNSAQERISPTYAAVTYGPHQRNLMDVWLAKSHEPTPVVVTMHGGAFLGGDRYAHPDMVRNCLDAGISVVAITYRYSTDAIAPAPFHDGARAIQYIRHHATKWNIDPKRIGAVGVSAGAGIALWLAFHEDLADSDNADPVLRNSTRLRFMMGITGQTSYDPRFIRKLFPESDTYRQPILERLFDVDLDNLDGLPDEKYRLFEECSPINHLTRDDPPVRLIYGRLDQPVTDQGIGIHHARFGAALKKKMDALDIECLVYAGDEVLGGDERIAPMHFMKRRFGMVD